MVSKIDHDRLDQIQNWSAVLGSVHTAAEEFEALRKIDKQSRSQRRRVQHLERHLDAGEVVCDCYEQVRSDRLGRA